MVTGMVRPRRRRRPLGHGHRRQQRLAPRLGGRPGRVEARDGQAHGPTAGVRLAAPRAGRAARRASGSRSESRPSAVGRSCTSHPWPSQASGTIGAEDQARPSTSRTSSRRHGREQRRVGGEIEVIAVRGPRPGRAGRGEQLLQVGHRGGATGRTRPPPGHPSAARGSPDRVEQLGDAGQRGNADRRVGGVVRARPGAATSAATTGTAARATSRSRVSDQCAPMASSTRPGVDRGRGQQAPCRLVAGTRGGRARPRPPARARRGAGTACWRRSPRAAVGRGPRCGRPPRLCVAQPAATCSRRRQLGGLDGRVARRRAATATRSVAVWASGNRKAAVGAARRRSGTAAGAHRLGVARRTRSSPASPRRRRRQRAAGPASAAGTTAGAPSTAHQRPVELRCASTRPAPVRSCGRTASASGEGHLAVVLHLDHEQVLAVAAHGRAYARCTASPLGTRTRVSTTGLAPTSCWRTAASRAGHVPAVLGADPPVERPRPARRRPPGPPGRRPRRAGESRLPTVVQASGPPGCTQSSPGRRGSGTGGARAPSNRSWACRASRRGRRAGRAGPGRPRPRCRPRAPPGGPRGRWASARRTRGPAPSRPWTSSRPRRPCSSPR